MNDATTKANMSDITTLAKTIESGDYLWTWSDEDPSDSECDDAERVLARRGLGWRTDDRGALVVDVAYGYTLAEWCNAAGVDTDIDSHRLNWRGGISPDQVRADRERTDRE